MLKAISGELTQVEQAYYLAIMSKVGSGTTKAVTAIKVGNVVDTQRRRRSSLVESYFSQVYP